MNVHAYPGKGLSLSQLVFALNEELKRTAYSPSFTFDEISQLDRDVSIALANIREWRNSLVCINRIPLDVLSLIPTHLHFQTADRFNASHVCRHWRRTFLQHAALWSHLFLPKGEIYVKTLLGRVRGSPLDIITNHRAPVGTAILLSPHTQQIRSLNFAHNYWADIRWFSEVNPGPLPLLRTLEINIVDVLLLAGQPDPMTPPSLPLFRNAVNLERFTFCLQRSSSLNHFVFPNLTTLELSTTPIWYGFQAADLLNFLEASPMLRTVEMNIIAEILLDGVARGAVVLPNVQTFSLFMDDGEPAYELAAHISCPSASHTSLTHEKKIDDIFTSQDIRDAFPTAASWDAIVRQYTTSPVEAISLEIKTSHDPIISCTLTFRSSDESIIRLGLEVSRDIGDRDEFHISFEEMVRGAFSEASKVVRDYPLLHDAKHLQILHRISLSDSEEMVHMAAIVELAKSWHGAGRPFECVTVRAVKFPVMMTEMLEPWVGVADCFEEQYTGVHDE